MAKERIKEILQNTFYQLLFLYSLIVLAISLGFLGKYALQFHIFAIVIALIGISLLFGKEKKVKEIKLNRKLHTTLLIIGLLLIILFRTIPYMSNTIPLGYDPGLYKYGIEHGLQNLDNWIVQGGMEPGFLYFMSILKAFFSSQTLLTWIFIAFSLLLGFAVYLTTKEYFGKNAGLIAIFLLALSFAQFKAFWYLYYKNIIGMSLLLFSFYFLKRYETTKKKWFAFFFILLGGLLGAIHRPTFYIFGLSYFVYAFVGPIGKKYDIKKLKFNVLAGIAILAIALVFYVGKFSQAITIMFEPVLQGFLAPGEGPGTFINFMTYQFSSLFYLPLALLGIFYLVRKKDWNPILIMGIITLAIVYFQFFFFNRFIIHLDLALLILASVGFIFIISQKKRLGIILLIILLLAGVIFAVQEANNSKPLINQDELTAIKQFNTTEPNAYAMSTLSDYSTWIIGYSERRTIAPGLFDYNLNSQSEWNIFWNTRNISEMKAFMLPYKAYNESIYLFIGQKQKDNLAQFSECFSVFYSQANNTIYRYNC